VFVKLFSILIKKPRHHLRRARRGGALLPLCLAAAQRRKPESGRRVPGLQPQVLPEVPRRGVAPPQLPQDRGQLEVGAGVGGGEAERARVGVGGAGGAGGLFQRPGQVEKHLE
jgi:hypothetical protein